MSTDFNALAEQLYLSLAITYFIQTYLDVLKNDLGSPSAESKE